MRTPIQDGFRMPPEWTRHQRTLVSWPVKESMCHPNTSERVEAGYASLIRAIAEFEPVTVLVDESTRSVAKRACGNGNIDFLSIGHNDSWLRDNGPTFLKSDIGGLAGVSWRFNAWGGKYAPWELDDAVACKVLSHYGVPAYEAPLVMEGGSFHTDGEGTLLVTGECLLNPNRNPGMTKQEISDSLLAYLGAEKIIWLGNGLDGDETDGHVDNLACFAAPGEVFLQTCNEETDPNFRVSQEALAVLRRERDAKGRPLQIIEIPQPPLRREGDKRLTLSYLNFYFVNGGIVLPVFGGDAEVTDREALKVLSARYPERRIRTIDGMAIVTEGGNIHCATQQMPG